MDEYKKRVADKLLEKKLKSKGAVLIQGAKWCGKTTTCEQIAKSAIYMDDPELMEQHRNYASINVKDLLRGARPRLIDEWQLAPQFWDAVRFEVDHAAAGLWWREWSRGEGPCGMPTNTMRP